MYRLCLFVWIVCVLNLPAYCLPTTSNTTNYTTNNTTNYTSISNRESISEEDQIYALENTALLEGDIVASNENSTEDQASGALHSVTRSSPRWPNAIINFKLDKRFYGE